MRAGEPGAAPPWLDGLRRGELDAREAFAREAIPRVVGWCTRLAGPGVDPEDAAQEVVLIALDRADRIYEGASVDGWLFGICRRVLANHRRRAWVRNLRGAMREPERLSSGKASPEDALAARRHADLARQCLAQLRPRHREVLVLYEIEQRSAEEVAEILGTTPQGIRALALRARKNMRKAAEKVGFRPEEIDNR